MKTRFQKNWGISALQGTPPSCANAMEAIGTNLTNAALKDNPDAHKLFDLAKEVIQQSNCQVWLSGSLMLLITGKGVRQTPHDIDIIIPQHLFDDIDMPAQWVELDREDYRDAEITVRIFLHDSTTVQGIPVLLNLIMAEPQQHPMLWGRLPIANIQDLVDAKVKYCLATIKPTRLSGKGIMVYKHMKDLVAIKQQSPHVQVLEKLSTPHLNSKEERFAFYFREMIGDDIFILHKARNTGTPQLSYTEYPLVKEYAPNPPTQEQALMWKQACELPNTPLPKEPKE